MNPNAIEANDVITAVSRIVNLSRICKFDGEVKMVLLFSVTYIKIMNNTGNSKTPIIASLDTLLSGDLSTERGEVLPIYEAGGSMSSKTSSTSSRVG